MNKAAPAPSDSGVAPTLLLAGHDTLQCAYYLRKEANSPFDFAALLAEREALRSAGSRDPRVFSAGGTEFLLHPYGSISRYPLVLSGPDYRVECGEFNRPSFYVTYRSEALWRRSAAELQTQFLNWAERAGLVQSRPEVVSRVDWAFDYHLPTVDFDEDHVVSLSAKDSKHRENRRTQTLMFGRDDIAVRIYDKVAEIHQKSHKTWLFGLWEGLCRDVWRVEWQVRGSVLKQFGIRTLQDLLDRQGDVLRYLATDHTTLRVPSGDTNRSRWALHPLWQDLQRLIQDFHCVGARRTDDLSSSLDERLTRCVLSVHGYLKRIAAIRAMQQGRADVIGLPFLLPDLRDLLRQIHDPLAWDSDVRKRIDQMRLGPL